MRLNTIGPPFAPVTCSGSTPDPRRTPSRPIERHGAGNFGKAVLPLSVLPRLLGHPSRIASFRIAVVLLEMPLRLPPGMARFPVAADTTPALSWPSSSSPPIAASRSPSSRRSEHLPQRLAARAHSHQRQRAGVAADAPDAELVAARVALSSDAPHTRHDDPLADARQAVRCGWTPEAE